MHCARTLCSSHHFSQTCSMFTCQMFGGEREAVLGCVVRRRRRLHVLLQQLVNLLIQKLLVGAGNSALQLRFVIDLENKSIKMSRALQISIYYLPESPVHMRVSWQSSSAVSSRSSFSWPGDASCGWSWRPRRPAGAGCNIHKAITRSLFWWREWLDNILLLLRMCNA